MCFSYPSYDTMRWYSHALAPPRQPDWWHIFNYTFSHAIYRCQTHLTGTKSFNRSLGRSPTIHLSALAVYSSPLMSGFHITYIVPLVLHVPLLLPMISEPSSNELSVHVVTWTITITTLTCYTFAISSSFICHACIVLITNSLLLNDSSISAICMIHIILFFMEVSSSFIEVLCFVM